jgi:mono/diheme cytochrome c family protein
MYKIISVRKTLLGAAMWMGSLPPAGALEDPKNGERLAKQWCANCHVVAPDQTSGSPDVPAFKSIAKRPDRELEKLHAFLQDPHPVMPNFGLSRQQIDDIVAYIRTLR